MSKTQAALQRRLGRLSVFIDLLAQDYPADSELIVSMKKEISLIKEISLRLVEVPQQHEQKHSHDGVGPPVTSRRP